jgi:hypothetical protein
MKIGYISERDSGVDYHRLIRPFGSMQERGQADVTRFNAIPLQNVTDVDVDVVVFNRCLWQEQEEVIAALKARGVKVICDVDDYWVLPSSHILYEQSKESRPRHVEALTLADEVWVTHDELKARVWPHNKNIKVIPNAIELSEDQWQITQLPPTPCIGYIAGSTHAPDIATTIGAWKVWRYNRILCGLTPSSAGVFKYMASIMSSNGTQPIEIAEARDVMNYGRFYDLCSVAIAPLANTAFNRCKSNLKILEAGAKGRPIFAQAMHPYIPFNSEGVIHVTDWRDAIRYANAMPLSEATERGLSLRREIEANWSMEVINQMRIDALN